MVYIPQKDGHRKDFLAEIKNEKEYKEVRICLRRGRSPLTGKSSK